MKKLLVASVLTLSMAIPTIGMANTETAVQFGATQQSQQQKQKDCQKNKEGRRHGKHGDRQQKQSQRQLSELQQKASSLTINQIGEAKADQLFVLEGNISKQTGPMSYVVKDATGELTVDISRRAWQGITATPNDKLKFYTQLDDRWENKQYQVVRVEKVTQ